MKIKQKKQLNMFGVFVVAVIIVVGVVVFVPNINKSENVKVGVLFPLSGSAAYYGEQGQRGIEIAKQEIKQNYPNLKIDIIYEDSLYTPQGGVDAYTTLKNIDDIDAVISMASHVSLAIQPLINKDNVLQMAVASTSGKYSTFNDLSFRTIPGVELQAEKIFEFLTDNNYNQLAIFTVNNDFGEGGKNALKDLIEDSEIKITNEETFLADQSDFRTELTKIKNLKPDVIYLVGTASNYANILKQAKDLQIDTQFISISSTEDPSLLKNTNGEAEGIVYTYYDLDYKNNQVAREFIDMYKKEYGENPEGYAAEGYEALMLISSAFNECGKDSECMKDYLEGLDNYNSVFGNLSFDENGDVYYNFILKTVKEGEFVKLT